VTPWLLWDACHCLPPTIATCGDCGHFCVCREKSENSETREVSAAIFLEEVGALEAVVLLRISHLPQRSLLVRQTRPFVPRHDLTIFLGIQAQDALRCMPVEMRWGSGKVSANAVC
jgi:hypothetical protein